jgi:protein-S-isoprenylcysteine O-methyltransferase Ste14
MRLDVPALVLFLILGTYWVRVIRMVIKARRREGHAAGLAPKEPVGRAIRLVWAPIVIAWVLHPLVVALVADPPRILRPVYRNAVVSWLGVVVAAAALAGTWVCWKRMGTFWRMGIDPGEKTPLVVTGPYALVRHPIYALSSVLVIASVAVAPTPVMIVLAVLHLVLLLWEAAREERHLLATHGETYAAYRRTVGRFVPRPRIS